MQKIAKINGDFKWEVLTFAKSSGNFTKCFGGQVLYLCSREAWGTWGTFPVMDRVLYLIGAGTLHAGSIFKEKHDDSRHLFFNEIFGKSRNDSKKVSK